MSYEEKKNFIYFPSGRYIDCLSLTHATNVKRIDTKNIQIKYESLKE